MPPVTSFTFNLPIQVPVVGLGLPTNSSDWLSEQHLRGFDGVDVTSLDAYRFLYERFEFGHKVEGAAQQVVYRGLTDTFFPGRTSFKSSEEPTEPVLVQGPKLTKSHILHAIDGDTIKIYVEGFGEINIRLDDLDTDESIVSSKLYRVRDGWYEYLNSTFDLGGKQADAIKALIQARIQYRGKVSKYVAQAFVDWFRGKHVSLAATFNRKSSSEIFCDVFDYADKFGRLLSRFLAGFPGQEEDLLQAFIRSGIHTKMATGGLHLYEEYVQFTQQHAPLLQELKTHKPDVYAFVSHEFAAVPSDVYSLAKMLKAAEAWGAFVNSNEEATNDFHTLMVFIGAAPPYPKYPSNKTALDMSAELYALGRGHGADGLFGLVNDPAHFLHRPNIIDPYLPHRNPVFLFAQNDNELWKLLTGSDDKKRLHPPDCCSVFGCSAP